MSLPPSRCCRWRRLLVVVAPPFLPTFASRRPWGECTPPIDPVVGPSATLAGDVADGRAESLGHRLFLGLLLSRDLGEVRLQPSESFAGLVERLRGQEVGDDPTVRQRLLLAQVVPQLEEARSRVRRVALEGSTRGHELTAVDDGARLLVADEITLGGDHRRPHELRDVFTAGRAGDRSRCTRVGSVDLQHVGHREGPTYELRPPSEVAQLVAVVRTDGELSALAVEAFRLQPVGVLLQPETCLRREGRDSGLGALGRDRGDLVVAAAALRDRDVGRCLGADAEFCHARDLLFGDLLGSGFLAHVMYSLPRRANEALPGVIPITSRGKAGKLGKSI